YKTSPPTAARWPQSNSCTTSSAQAQEVCQLSASLDFAGGPDAVRLVSPLGPLARSCLELHRGQVNLLAVHAPVFFRDFKDADIGRYLASVGLGIFAEDCRRLDDHARLGLRVKATSQSVDLEAHDRLGSLPSGSEHRVGFVLDKVDPDARANLRCVD